MHISAFSVEPVRDMWEDSKEGFLTRACSGVLRGAYSAYPSDLKNEDLWVWGPAHVLRKRFACWCLCIPSTPQGAHRCAHRQSCLEFAAAADCENLRHRSEAKVTPLMFRGTWRTPPAKSEHPRALKTTRLRSMFKSIFNFFFHFPIYSGRDKDQSVG